MNVLRQFVRYFIRSKDTAAPESTKYSNGRANILYRFYLLSSTRVPAPFGNRVEKKFRHVLLFYELL